MTEVGYASLGIIPSFDGFERKLSSGTHGPMSTVGDASGKTFGDAAGKTAGSRFGSVFKNAAKAGLVGLGVLGVGAFKLAQDSIGAASDLEESTNKVQQVFGEGAESVFKFSEKAADRLGQTNQQARDAAATFGLFGNIAGLSDKKSAKFATRMTTLASDLASFHNTEPSEAVEALGAALRGEAEPIRSYGVLLDEATLKAEALRLGLIKPVKDQAKIKSYQMGVIEGQRAYNDAVKEFGKGSFEAEKAEASLGTKRELLQKATEGTIEPLTQQQKILAAQSSVFKQTEVAQGDFARTSDGLANQQRRLSARFEDAKAKLGTGLLPIMTDAADFLLDKGIPAFEDFSDWFNRKGIPGIKGFADEAKPVVGYVKDLVGFIGDLPKDVKLGALTGVAGLAAFAKLRGGGGGALGTAGGALGITKPIPVLVTNKGFGATTGAAGGAAGSGAVVGPDGKPTKGSRLRSKGNTLGAILASVSLPWIVDEFQAEVDYARNRVRQGTFHPSTTKLPQSSGARGGDALAGLLLDPLGTKKIRDGNDAVKQLGGQWVATGERVDQSTQKMLVGTRKIPPAVDKGKHSVKQLQDVLAQNPRRVDTRLTVSGVERAHSQIDGLMDALGDFATGASDALDNAGALVVGGRGRGGSRPRNAGRDQQRRRNLGGTP